MIATMRGKTRRKNNVTMRPVFLKFSIPASAGFHVGVVWLWHCLYATAWDQIDFQARFWVAFSWVIVSFDRKRIPC